MIQRAISIVRRPLARALSTATYTAPPPASNVFAAWLQDPTRPLSSPATVREFLGVPTNVDPTSLTLQSRRDVVASPAFVQRISAVAQWGFKAHGDASVARDAARVNEVEQLFQELSPWGNMAKGDVWQHFYLRRFFLSRAPLETFLACYDVHRRVLEAAGQSFLALPSALPMRELVWRGRFHEAVAAYTRLDLDDAERRSFTALLFEYEQYETLCSVYVVQDEIDQEREEPLLDPLFILHALKELGRRDELMDRFEMLSHEDQGRAEIQKLVSNA